MTEFRRDPDGLRRRMEQAMGDRIIMRAPGYNADQVMPVVVIPPASGVLQVEVVNPSTGSAWEAWTPGSLPSQPSTSPRAIDNGQLLEIEVLTAGTGDTHATLQQGSTLLPWYPGLDTTNWPVRLTSPSPKRPMRVLWKANSIVDAPAFLVLEPGPNDYLVNAFSRVL